MYRLLLTVGLLLTTFFGISQSITGDWKGELEVQGTRLPIQFHIRADSVKGYSATFDSPAQMAYGLPCSSVELRADSLVLFMKNLNGQYAAKFSAGATMLDGIWTQSGSSFPMKIVKERDQATAPRLNRPQTPKPPFPYTSEDLIYTDSTTHLRYGATLTDPSGKTPQNGFPAVLLITGSGQQDRDETLLGHKPFAVIADYLSRRGIAVMRIDDRGVGKTTGDPSKATSADFALDVQASLRYLKTRKEINKTQIGLLGHSEGGMIAPMVAAKDPEIAWIILLAGPGIPIMNLMEQQSADVLKSQGVEQQAIEQYRIVYRNLLTAILNHADEPGAKDAADAVLQHWMLQTASGIVEATTGIRDEASRKNFIQAFVRQIYNPWMRYFLKYDPAENLKHVKCPVLALNAANDIQVAAEPNIEAIKRILLQSGNQNVEAHIFPSLNHLFQPCETCTLTEYALIETTISEPVLQRIAEWIQKKTALK